MTRNDDFDRALSDWFEAGALASPPVGGLERVLETTRRQRPRPGWLAGPGSQWLGEPARARLLLPAGLQWSTLLVLLALVAIVVGAVVVGSRLVGDDRPGALAYAFNGDIFVADWDGANAVLIADGDPWGGEGSEMCGSFGANGRMWSPDGRLLAFGSERDTCGWTTRIADPRGSAIATLEGGNHAWSPDSTRIATFDELGSIWIYDNDGVIQSRLQAPLGLRADVVVGEWSVDGAFVVISQGSQTWQIPTDGGAARRLSVGDTAPQLSPDGSRIAFTDGGALWVASPGQTDRRELVPNVDRDFIWSPRGDRIAFVGVPDEPDGTRGNFIGVVDPTTGEVSWPLGRGLPEPGLELQDYSANGDLILYSVSESATAGLWSVSLSSGESRQLVPGEAQGEWRPPTDP
jgi:Tol biopolymer transport system component